jgi:hypothetical protein
VQYLHIDVGYSFKNFIKIPLLHFTKIQLSVTDFLHAIDRHGDLNGKNF